MELNFKAPWGRELRLMTILAMVVCFGAMWIGIQLPSAHPWAKYSAIAIPSAILLGGAGFMVRSYTLRNGTLLIHRLGWSTRLELASLRSAEFDPNAIAGSIRLFGNGGLFSFSGWFRNQKLGKYRAFGTDLKRCVVLKFPSQTVVITPENPEKFVERIKELK